MLSYSQANAITGSLPCEGERSHDDPVPPEDPDADAPRSGARAAAPDAAADPSTKAGDRSQAPAARRGLAHIEAGRIEVR